MHLQYLAEALAKQGIASLRYDTRGVAKSMLALKGEDYLDFEKTVTDAAGWITQVRKDNRFSTMSVFGISLPNDYGREASLAAIIAANRMNADGLLCVGADSRKYLAMIRGKAAMTFPAHTAGYVDSLAQVLEQGKRFDLKPSDGIAYNLFRPAIQPYVLALNKFDPRAEMAKVKVPSVIVHGSMDYSIPIEVVAALASANPQAQFVSVKNMSFYLKNGNDDLATPSLQKHKLPILQEFINLATEYVFSVNKVQ